MDLDSAAEAPDCFTANVTVRGFLPSMETVDADGVQENPAGTSVHPTERFPVNPAVGVTTKENVAVPPGVKVAFVPEPLPAATFTDVTDAVRLIVCVPPGALSEMVSTPASLSFGDQKVGTTSDVQSVTLPGSGALFRDFG